jgi:S-formylglutathione hydrolase
MKSAWGLIPAVLLAGCHTVQEVLPDHPRLFAGVAMRDVTFRSASLGREMTYRVYLPENVPAGRKLPVVYLLHGNGGGYQNWSNYSDVGQYAARGVVLVMVDGDSSYYMNEAESPADKYEDYFLHEVMPDAENRFPVSGDRAHRTITGVSAGGFAAVKLALTRPELFAFAGAISPALDVSSRRFSALRWSQSMRFRRIFGADGSATRRAADPFVLVKTADPARTPYLYVTAGENEPLREPITRFAGLLKARGFAYEFHTKPGGHDWTEWDAQAPGCIEALLHTLM